MRPTPKTARGRPARGRPAGQVATRRNILRTAIRMFADQGYAGARIDKISAAAGCTDRMIYYYFGSKERLFVAVLEMIYEELGLAEAALDLAGLGPEDCLRAIVRFTWSHYRRHPEMLALLNNENLLKGRHVIRSKRVKELSFPLLSTLSEVLALGVRDRVFRADVTATDAYLVMCSLGYFYLSNRHTLSAFLGLDLMAKPALERWPGVMEQAVLRFLRAPRRTGRRPTTGEDSRSERSRRVGSKGYPDR